MTLSSPSIVYPHNTDLLSCQFQWLFCAQMKAQQSYSHTLSGTCYHFKLSVVWETIKFYILAPEFHIIDNFSWNLSIWQSGHNNCITTASISTTLSERKGQTIIPSGWAIFCMAVGASMIGMEILKPRIVVVMSILLTSIRIRGRNLYVCQSWFSKH